MKADRLLAILVDLQTNGRVTAKELAVRLEVSKRTILRDMESLAMAGIPVYAERGYQGGWSLSDGYRTRLTGLTADEIASLLLVGSSSAVKDLGLTGAMEAAMGKLLSALPEAVRQDAEIARQRIHIDGAGWRATPAGVSADPEVLTKVQQAVWEARKLRIGYRGADSVEAKERVVAPLGLVAKTNVWYLAALVEEDVRTYRVSRIVWAETLGETFARPAQFDLAAYWEASTERFRATLPRYSAVVRVTAALWPRFRQERYVFVHGEPMGAPKEDWVEAQVEFHTLESACGILLSYGRHAEAVGPAELRELARSEMRAALAMYG